eukprot:CAMPEP_0172698770 /NCGR_PEP_ID=MMETSP1074-20121228/29704_1 /TAXON_ID=2916 /ORGANISM="Ceratium fusus, Strain PA161109" /LENGTH=485 /DNA_ID=CAMNT_0013519857 /DNA_START=41 /DNA_END=1498 /DNA_ORIENTATION=-
MPTWSMHQVSSDKEVATSADGRSASMHTCRQAMEPALRSRNWSMSTASFDDDDLEDGEIAEDSDTDLSFVDSCDLFRRDELEEGEVSEEEDGIPDEDEAEDNALGGSRIMEQDLHFDCFLKGKVQTAIVKSTREVVAVKNVMQGHSAQRRKFEAELCKVMSRSCQAIVQYHGTVLLGDNHPTAGLNLVMEFHDLGGLDCLIDRVGRCGTTLVPMDHVAFISHSVATGLKFLHDMGIVHRRVKPENILHNTMGEVKLTDVVQSNELDFDCMALPVRTYASPEQCLGAKCGPEEDIWSFGLVLHELVTGTFPYVGNSHMELFQMVARMPEPRLDPALCPEPLCDLLARCLTRDSMQHLLEQEDVSVQTSDAEAACGPVHLVVQSLAGEQVFGCEFTEPLRASDLAALICESDARWHGNLKLVLAGRVLQPSEIICGGSEGAPMTITLVSLATTQCRASAAELLDHGFCYIDHSSQEDFANWLKALGA